MYPCFFLPIFYYAFVVLLPLTSLLLFPEQENISLKHVFLQQLFLLLLNCITLVIYIYNDLLPHLTLILFTIFE